MAPAASARLEWSYREDGGLELHLSGAWTLDAHLPPMDPLLRRLAGTPGVDRVRFDCRGLTAWDSRLLAFLVKFLEQCRARDIAVDLGGLPSGARDLMELARVVPEAPRVLRPVASGGLVEDLGRRVLNGLQDGLNLVDFLGEAVLAAVRLVSGRARLRGKDLLALLVESGPNAVPIIGLISFLVGMILAFVGAVQLRLFGAQVFIADLVGLGMAREMGAMMTAVLMAGRSGAAFAAQLGAMQVNDEIDALRTSGVPPMEFLVLPRLLALTLCLPLLCLYADALGILGGATVSAALFDVSLPEFLHQLRNRLTVGDFLVGIGKSLVFGFLVAIAGCQRGLTCGRNSQAVGLAATSAVVTGIVLIVVADAVMTLVITSLKLTVR